MITAQTYLAVDPGPDPDILFALSAILDPDALLDIATGLIVGDVLLAASVNQPGFPPERHTMIYATPDEITRGVTDPALPRADAAALFADYLLLTGVVG